MPDPSQFNTDRTDPGRWTVTFSNPPINMFLPTTIVVGINMLIGGLLIVIVHRPEKVRSMLNCESSIMAHLLGDWQIT